eukprot:gene5804-1035_t
MAILYQRRTTTPHSSPGARVVSEVQSPPEEGLRRTNSWNYGDVQDVLHKTHKPVTKNLRRKNEVRSVFGWTDIPTQDGEDEPEGQEDEGGRTLSQHQDSLPTLPVPPLEQTLQRYIESMEPLLLADVPLLPPPRPRPPVSNASELPPLVGYPTPLVPSRLRCMELAEATAMVNEFGADGGVGQMLQAKLEAMAAGTVPSWLEKYWDDSYQYDRGPSSINVNYFFGFEDPEPGFESQVGRAASLLRGSLLFYVKIHGDTLQPDSERGKPLCMSQYLRIFGVAFVIFLSCLSVRTLLHSVCSLCTLVCQNPMLSRSQACRTTRYKNMDPRHVIVMCQNRFFVCPVFHNGVLDPLEQIEANLAYILQQSSFDPGSPTPPIGVFTASQRSVWASNRQELISLDPTNENSLDLISSALLVLCLDHIAPADLTELSRLLLHGPSTNRWFDKNQLIVCANGKAGFNFEHCAGDGSTTLRMADETYTWSCENGHKTDQVAGPKMARTGELVELQWVVSPEIAAALHTCWQEFKQAIVDNDTKAMKFCRFGGLFIKNHGMSPDAFVQLAIQLASYKMTGIPCATYESASTRQFLHGRTETVRSCTTASLKFCQNAHKPLLPRGDCTHDEQTPLQLLQQAVKIHVSTMVNAKNGYGIDRHLFVLKVTLATAPLN